ncbi:histidine phosphatase superfamily [Leucosporidium creatinivorum]|uniref:Histidine phosphatase superfamily n=1 Tax=Leucosporidium creatinivorum TaxID=106004 RepID=A0A1Y2FWL0_9BASI|nr:histidine phosphatase superfamily [Leucosporidium creatinivorum]
MPKTIYFTRHAQATHNVDPVFESASQRRDAPLTDIGREQAAALHQDTKDSGVQREAELLVASPLRRPVQTMLIGYPDLVQRLQRPNIILLPELQEITNLPCDTGLERHELEGDPELAGLDFSVLDQSVERHGVSWTSKKGFFDAVNVEKRAVWVKKWLRARPEEVIVVVAHGDILWIMTGDHGEAHWANAEVRAYTFVSEDDELAAMKPIGTVAKEGADEPTSSEK